MFRNVSVVARWRTTAGLLAWLSACQSDEPERMSAASATEPVLDASGEPSGARGTMPDAAVAQTPGPRRPMADAGAMSRPDAETASDAGRVEDDLAPLPSNRRGCAAEPAGNPLPAAASVRRLQTGFSFVEGPVWLDDQGALLFSDLSFGASGAGGRIHRFVPPNTFEVFAEQANSNGLALGVDGSVLACSQDVRSLSRYDAVTGARADLDLRYEGQRFNAPNDLVVRSDGIVYFTDPDFGRGASETGISGVYRLALDESVALVTSDLDRPNGIAFSPDEGTLYVGAATAVMAYPMTADGSVGAGEMFAAFGPADGLAVDCAGNLYVTGDNQLHVFGPDGTAFGEIDVPEETTNAAFGGPAHKTLYITASSSLYALDLEVTGMPY